MSYLTPRLIFNLIDKVLILNTLNNQNDNFNGEQKE